MSESLQNSVPLHQIYPTSHGRRIARIGLGASMLGLTVAGGALVASGTINLHNTIASIEPAHAEPSNGLSDLLTIGIEAGAALGAFAFAKRGAHQILRATSSRTEAIHDIAHAQSKNEKNQYRQGIAYLSGLAVVVGALAGNFADVAHAAADSETEVATTLGSLLNKSIPSSNHDTFVISNVPRPELATDSAISPEAVSKISRGAKTFGVTAAPVHVEWHTVYPGSGKGAKETVLTVGFPEELVPTIKPANKDCNDIEVLTAKSMGYHEGNSFTLDGRGGLRVKVAGTKGTSGANLTPIIFSSEDFARCVDNDPNYPPTILMAEGSNVHINQLLKAEGLNGNDMADRVYAIPLSEYESDTQQTGENDADGYVLPALVEALGLGLIALSSRSRYRIINNRRIYTSYEANGTRKKILASIENELADSQAVWSGLAAAPLVVLLDYLDNTGTPGGRLGPEILTLLFVVGSTWGGNRLGTSIAMRRESSKIDLAKGHNL